MLRTRVTILAGFLGAGKTTLLNALLRHTPEPLGVIVNDFGSVNIDAALVAGHTALDGEVALQNGCICCTIRGDLLAALLRLRRRENPPSHIIIEASGVSDPAAVARTFVDPRLSDQVELAAIVGCVDPTSVSDLLGSDRGLASSLSFASATSSSPRNTTLRTTRSWRQSPSSCASPRPGPGWWPRRSMQCRPPLCWARRISGTKLGLPEFPPSTKARTCTKSAMHTDTTITPSRPGRFRRRNRFPSMDSGGRSWPCRLRCFAPRASCRWPRTRTRGWWFTSSTGEPSCGPMAHGRPSSHGAGLPRPRGWTRCQRTPSPIRGLHPRRSSCPRSPYGGHAGLLQPVAGHPARPPWLTLDSSFAMGTRRSAARRPPAIFRATGPS